MPGAAQQHQRLLAQREQPQPRWRLAGQADQGQVELARDDLAGQAGRARGGLAQVHGHPRVRVVEPAEQFGQVDGAGGGQRAHGERAAQPGPGLGHRILRGLRRGQRGPGLGEQGLAGVGQRHPVPVPVEQHRAELAFQALDGAGHAGLHHMQPARGPGEGQFLGHHHEFPQALQRRQLTCVDLGTGFPAVRRDHHHLPCR